mgnify:CR=1 FL=1
MYGCAHTLNKKSAPTSYNELIEKYSDEYFIGVGNGNGSSEQLAIKIAKINALGSLSESIKVSIFSKTELFIEEISLDSSSEITESFKQQIISIGNATVRSPEYTILNISSKNGVFQAQVLAKKLKRQHIEEAVKDLESIDDVDKFLDLLGK